MLLQHTHINNYVCVLETNDDNTITYRMSSTNNTTGLSMTTNRTASTRSTNRMNNTNGSLSTLAMEMGRSANDWGRTREDRAQEAFVNLKTNGGITFYSKEDGRDMIGKPAAWKPRRKKVRTAYIVPEEDDRPPEFFIMTQLYAEGIERQQQHDAYVKKVTELEHVDVNNNLKVELLEKLEYDKKTISDDETRFGVAA